MTLVIEGKNGRDLHLPQPPQTATGRAITLVFLQTVAVIIALWYAITGGGRRFRRLTQKDAYERDLLEAAVRIHWRNGRFAGDNPFTAIKRLFHIVIAIAWHAEMRGRPDTRLARDAMGDPEPADGVRADTVPDDSS